MSGLTCQLLQAASGGTWLTEPESDREVRGVQTDSRVDLADCAFLAIRGPRHDGHDFLAQAVERGASLLIVEREPSMGLPRHVPVLKVASTTRALLDLARAHRRNLLGTVVAITGSAGKTTTKHLTHAILQSQFRGTAAPRSFNNDIGVPVTILNAQVTDDYLVLELGTNAPGEIGLLASIAAPDVAVITSIGRSHLERLGSVEAVAREKASIFQHMRREGLAILHDAASLAPLVPAGIRVIQFGRTDNADLQLTGRGAIGDHWWLELNGTRRFELNLPGEHHALNAIAAIAVARHMGMADDVIAAALGVAPPPAMRLVRHHIRGINIQNDAYNANPESMAAALRTFGEIAAGAVRRVLVLGDMRELGSHAQHAHSEVGQRILGLHGAIPLHLVILVGPLMAHAAGILSHARPGFRLVTYDDMNERTAGRIAGMLRPGDAVLLKGSRAMGMELVIEALSDLCGVAPPRDTNATSKSASEELIHRPF